MTQKYEFIKFSSQLISIDIITIGEKTVQYTAPIFTKNLASDNYAWLNLPLKLHKQIDKDIESTFYIAQYMNDDDKCGTIYALEENHSKSFFKNETLPLIRHSARSAYFPVRSNLIKKNTTIFIVCLLLLLISLFLAVSTQFFSSHLSNSVFYLSIAFIVTTTLLWPLLRRDKARIPELLKQLENDGFSID